MPTTILGWIATGLSSLYRIPQIIKLIKTKKSDAISKKAYFIQTSSYILYIAHGIIIKDKEY